MCEAAALITPLSATCTYEYATVAWSWRWSTELGSPYRLSALAQDRDEISSEVTNPYSGVSCLPDRALAHIA